jgi:hypothetical protein
MTVPVVILYEDQRGPTNGFGLHELVVSCVADHTGKARWAVKALLIAVPKKGDTKLLRACREEAAGFAPRGEAIFALFDNDKIRSTLKLDADLCRSRTVASILEGGSCAVDVVLLQRNLESVISAVGGCLGLDVTDALSKDLNARDIALNKAAFHAQRSIRDCVLGGVEDLKRLVTRVAAKISA